MKRLIALATAGLLALAFVIPAQAADQGTGCPSDPERVRFYENTIADNSDGDDTVIFCGLGASDLEQIAHTVAGTCKGGIFKTGDNWNECISSFYAVIPSGRVLVVYGAKNFDSNYVHYIYTHSSSGRRIDLPASFNDGMSSWHFLNLV
jgi:hypothetical protein